MPADFWPIGIRGKAIRLLNDAGFDVKEPLAAELAEMLTASAKRLHKQAGGVSDWAAVTAAATMLPDNPTALPHLSENANVDGETAFQALTKLAYQALLKRAEIEAR
jgi:hypothetical protein